jgi:hypothetical protein
MSSRTVRVVLIFFSCSLNQTRWALYDRGESLKRMEDGHWEEGTRLTPYFAMTLFGAASEAGGSQFRSHTRAI